LVVWGILTLCSRSRHEAVRQFSGEIFPTSGIEQVPLLPLGLHCVSVALCVNLTVFMNDTVIWCPIHVLSGGFRKDLEAAPSSRGKQLCSSSMMSPQSCQVTVLMTLSSLQGAY
jgi:hypothetical protein